jgi:stage III sporulation protein AH
MKGAKKNILILTVLLFVCAAVYLNWSYNNRWGAADSSMVAAEDAAAEKAEQDYTAAMSDKSAASSDYFAKARLTRQTSRDEALNLLKSAASSEGASQETIDGAMKSISAMATYSMKETQMENELIAKGFTDCVVYITDDAVTVSVPAPKDGLTAEQVAQITDIVTTESDYTAAQLNVVEIK